MDEPANCPQELDAVLDKSGLISTVMGAGDINGERYVLPFHYNFPVVYVNVPQLEAACYSIDNFKNDISGLLDVE